MYLAIAIQLSIICIIQSATLPNTQDCSGCYNAAAIPSSISVTGTPGPRGEKGEKGEPAPTNIQPKSAFSVAYSSISHRHPASPMKYSKIITNVGNDYDIKTGKFVCEHPGIYVFQFTSGSSMGDNIISTTIMKNKERILSSKESGSGNKSATNMVVLDLVANDEVWTQPYSTDHNYYFSDDAILCSFSGFLLYASS